MFTEISGAAYPFTSVHTLHGPFIDEPIARDGKYLTQNHLGSTTTLSDSTGQVVEGYAYLPFGETWASSGSSDPLQALGSNPFQFTGRENDGTGLMYYRARYYAPEWGRFISEDPIGFAGGLNHYACSVSSSGCKNKESSS